MVNIKSLGDYVDSDNQSPYSYAGGHNSAIGIDGGGHVVNLYADGFTVDDGPFRPIGEPENARFIADIRKGVAPRELQDGSREVNVHLIDHQSKCYNAEQSAPSASSGHKVATSHSEWCLGEANTTLRIKLLSGDVINLRISQEASVGDLRRFVAQHTPPGAPVSLLVGYPPRRMALDDATTLREADILNCNVIQK